MIDTEQSFGPNDPAFDRVGLKWQYEPFDLGSWSPDFLVEDGRGGTLVEVKPITELSYEEASKPALACYERKIDYPHFVIVGTGPIVTKFRQTFADCFRIGGEDIYEEPRIQIGWLVPGYDVSCSIEQPKPPLHWWELALEWLPRRDRPDMFPTLSNPANFREHFRHRPWHRPWRDALPRG